MPDYTSLGISFPLPTDDIKRAQLEAKLAEDIKQTAVTANQAILVESARAADAAVWMKDVVLAAGDSLDAFAGTAAGKQAKAKIPNATVAAGIAGWPAGLTHQGATVISHGLTGSVSLQQLQTHSNTDPRLYIRTTGQPWREVTRQLRRYAAQTITLASGSMHLQRSGNDITVTLNGATPAAGSNLIGTLPMGYRNEIRNAYGFPGRTGTGLPASFEITEYAEIRQYSTHEAALYGVLKFQTNEEYPA